MPLFETSTVCGRRNCSACTRWKLLHEFSPRTWQRGKIKYVQSICRMCQREHNRAEYMKQVRGGAESALDARRRSWRRAQRKRKGLNGDGAGFEERMMLARLQQAYLDARARGAGVEELSERIGMSSSQLQRALGLAPNDGYWVRGVSYERAAQLSRAVGVDPVDVGL